MQDLTLTIIQSNLHWESIDANLAMFEEKIWQIEGKTDLIILPEMFSTGFSMNARKLAEPMNSKTFRWMLQQSRQTAAVVTGSFIVREKEKFYNRLVWMQPNGEFEFYDKRHLFRMAKEQETYSQGNEVLIKDLKGWRISPLICYDLRFPVWSRQGKGLSYDCLIYVANWPERRSIAWNTLLKARAIENLCYVVGVNRVGKDGSGDSYAGDSTIIKPTGEVVFTENSFEKIFTATISKAELEEYRKAFPAHLDADEFQIKK